MILFLIHQKNEKKWLMLKQKLLKIASFTTSFVRYNREKVSQKGRKPTKSNYLFVITEFVITEFDCSSNFALSNSYLQMAQATTRPQFHQRFTCAFIK